jgi:hypothetical protein
MVSEQQDDQFSGLQIHWLRGYREELNLESNIFRHMSRRALLETILAAGSVPLLAESRPHAQAPGAAPQPFRVDIPQTTIDRILNRVRDAHWPDRLEANDWRYRANRGLTSNPAVRTSSKAT